MNVRLASLIACAALAPAFFSAAQAQTQLYFNGFEDYTLGAFGTQGLGQGWHVTNVLSGETQVNVVSGNSPFAPGGTKSLNVARTAGSSGNQPRPNLYFGNQTIGGTQITGVLGGNVSGQSLKNMTFSWDFTTSTLWTQPQFGFYNGVGIALTDVAVLLEIRNEGGVYGLRYADGGGYSFHGDYVFKNNTWYNFEVSNIDTANHTYDVKVFEYGVSNAVVLINGAKFYADIDELGMWRATSNSMGTHNFTIDNYSITQIPESGTYALLIAFSAVALIGLRRRFKK